ncbi:MAG: arylsulfatase [Kiritimatiellae bacterium]|nr:arylsulfatase [Kiritimatiellia bacterium]
MALANAAEQPNVVVILADDQGWGDLSLHGNTNLETPNIDSLARDGAQFDCFYVSPVCSPTRAEFLTGRHHVRCGVWSTSEGGERINADETTIADVFKRAGYKTAAFGKWHSGMQYPYHPNARGFDEFYGFCSGHWGNYFSPMLQHNGELVKGKGFVIDDFTERAMAFIEANKGSPFFVYLPYNTPHSPMQVPEPWWNKFKDKPIALSHRYLDQEQTDFTRAALAMCENIDWNVGRVLKKLDDLGLSKNTIVIYFSDNGPNSFRWNGDMRGRKGTTDEGGVRSPLFVRWPGIIKPGTEVAQICSAMDLLPTLADLAKVPITGDKPLDGISLKSLLFGDKLALMDRTLISHWARKVSVRTQQYRLDHQNKLYDMIADPGQRTDIAAQQPAVADCLIKIADSWKNEMLSDFGKEFDDRPFVIGDPKSKFTQIPARDGVGHGNIKRSSRHPNCSFFTNWSDREDKITWECEVGTSGAYKVELLYTCSAADIGSTVMLSFNESTLVAKITEPHDPPLVGMEHDRVKRQESYVKDFKRTTLGNIQLEKGKGTLTLKSLEMPGKQVMDFRLLFLTRSK